MDSGTKVRKEQKIEHLQEKCENQRKSVSPGPQAESQECINDETKKKRSSFAYTTMVYVQVNKSSDCKISPFISPFKQKDSETSGKDSSDVQKSKCSDLNPLNRPHCESQSINIIKSKKNFGESQNNVISSISKESSGSFHSCISQRLVGSASRFEEEGPAVSHSTVKGLSIKKSPAQKTKRERVKGRTMNVKGYSFDLKKARDLVFNYDPQEGCSILSPDSSKEIKIVEPGEESGVIVKIRPDKPFSSEL
ncbi:Uncharacterized protein FKW44_005859 [Caligus rogercresseyi]|uniref:Uncharacterized protein n=1 Tax=Caligus rogercresseyi TaxID=217165 RepID=A0A7T8QSE0_CALRO|nr:Uncharacterized protein FKW44_005859 [Caligus rogercresseyi]